MPIHHQSVVGTEDRGAEAGFGVFQRRGCPSVELGDSLDQGQTHAGEPGVLRAVSPRKKRSVARCAVLGRDAGSRGRGPTISVPVAVTVARGDPPPTGLGGENFTALSRRLATACCNRSRSPCIGRLQAAYVQWATVRPRSSGHRLIQLGDAGQDRREVEALEGGSRREPASISAMRSNAWNTADNAVEIGRRPFDRGTQLGLGRGVRRPASSRRAAGAGDRRAQVVGNGVGDLAARRPSAG